MHQNTGAETAGTLANIAKDTSHKQRISHPDNRPMHATEQHALEEHRSTRRNKRTQRIVNDAAKQDLLHNRPCQPHC